MAVLTKLSSLYLLPAPALGALCPPTDSLWISRAAAQGKQMLGAWNFYLALPALLAITPTSGFLSQDHTNNPCGTSLKFPPVPRILADWQTHPSFSFPPHMQSKNSESEDSRIQSALNDKGKKSIYYYVLILVSPRCVTWPESNSRNGHKLEWITFLM